jgi:NAD(P)H dehydrogenase (quinone)
MALASFGDPEAGAHNPSENELAGARYQGRLIAETANKLHG